MDRTVGLDAVHADIGMLRTPDGHARVESTRVITPPAIRSEPHPAPANTLGIWREMAKYDDHYRLCFVRGPEGFIIGLAEQLG